MAYVRLNLTKGDVLKDSHLAHIEDALVDMMGEQFEIQWESGGIDTTKGTNNNTANRRRTVGFIPINYSILTLSVSQNFHIVCYDSDKNFVEALPSTSNFYSLMSLDLANVVSESTAYYRIFVRTGDTMQDDCWTISVKDKLPRVNNEIIVDCNGNGDYTTIEDALFNALDSPTNHVTIRVKAGTYYPAPKLGTAIYRESNRNLSIIGENKNKVILRGDCGYYDYQIRVDYAPLRLSGNVTIENLTIESYSSQYETKATENGWDLTSPHCRAYCIHVDTNRLAGDEIVIKNCRLINDHFTTVGFGLRQDSTLRIENCELITTTTDDTLSGFSNYGTVYGHLHAGAVATGQRVEILNNRIVNKGYSTAINLMDGSGQTEGCEASYLLVGNVCDTTDLDNALAISNTRDFWTKDKMCFGNNVEAMNA